MARLFGIVLVLMLMAVPVLATAQSDLSDAEVAHVAVTANAIDVEMAELVGSRTRTEAVRQFAATMIRDHNAVNERAAALAGRLGVTPADNAVSESLRSGAEEAKASLRGLRGAAFDRAYMEREVGYHQAVLDALDGLLIPTTSNGELRALLEEVRPAIAAHLEHAKELGSKLGKEGERAAHAVHTVAMRGFAFHPERLEVSRGERVVWVNRDMVPHTATSAEGGWDSGNMSTGEEWTLSSAEPGRTEYDCTLHPSMRGVLVVR